MKNKYQYTDGYLVQLDEFTFEILEKSKITNVQIGLATNDKVIGIYVINNFVVFCGKVEIRDDSKVDNREFFSEAEVIESIASELQIPKEIIETSVECNEYPNK